MAVKTSRKVWIRPVCREGTDILCGLAVVTHNRECLVDEEILEHFPLDATGREIADVALGVGWVDSPEDVRWGNVLH